jgi:hypothetical protein
MRLSLNPVLDRRATVHGTWWPRTCDAAAELPALIAAVDQRLGRVTLRVNLYQDAWEHLPGRIPARGRQIRVGWLRSADAHVIILDFAVGEPIVLVVVPPGAASAPGAAVRAPTVGNATLLNTTLLPADRSPAGRPAYLPFSDRRVS